MDKEVVADEVETPEPERSIRDELESSLAEVNARHESEVEPPAGEAPTNGRPRDASGRFAASANPAAPSETGTRPDQAGSGVGAIADRSPAASPGQTPPTVEPPQGWSAAEKAVWATVPPAAQAAIARREQDFHRKLTEHDEIRSVGNQFMSAANEHTQLIQARNTTPVALFKEFLGILNQIHTSDPQSRTQLFRQLAARNGVSFDPAQPGQTPSPQPQNFQLPAPVQQTVQEWNAFKAQQERLIQEQQAAEMQQTQAEIETFRSNPAYPHFDTLTGLMTSILRGGVASTLEEAYSLAVKAHPETSKALEAEATAKRQAEEAARQKAQQARRKAGSLRTGAGGIPPSELNGSKGSVRDDLKAAFESARGRI